MKFDNKTDIEIFINNIHEQINNKTKNITINNINIIIGEEQGWSQCVDDRVPGKNITEIKEREKLALAYEENGDIDMAAYEWEECARELLWNCISATLNISNKNILALNTYLTKSKKCWHEFSGVCILPSQSESY